MKKGFTLIEIIVCIALIAVISVSSIIGLNMFSNAKNDKKLENIANKIYEAASIYIETNKEAKNKLYTDKNGVFIPLTVLKNEGLMEFQDIDIEDEYVVTFLGGSTPGEKCVGATTIGSWSKGDHTIYICTDSNLKEEIKQEVLEELGVGSNVLKEAIINNAKKADGTTARSVYDENNNLKYDYRLIKINDEYVFAGDTKDNYVNFNGMCWRATRIQKDGSIKLLLQDKDSTCNSANYKGAWSIGEGHFGYTKNDPVSSFKKADYSNGETDPTESMNYKLDAWFKVNFSGKLDYLKENSWAIEDVSSNVRYETSYYYGETKDRGVSLTYILNTYSTGVAYYENLTSFKSYIATIRSSEYQPYMSTGTINWWLLGIGGINIESKVSIAEFVYGNRVESYGKACDNSLPIRPMIVLKDGVKISGGAGTQINPYVIEE